MTVTLYEFKRSISSKIDGFDKTFIRGKKKEYEYIHIISDKNSISPKLDGLVNTFIWTKTNEYEYMFYRNFQKKDLVSHNIPHITTVCAHTITVYITGKQVSGPHVY